MLEFTEYLDPISNQFEFGVMNNDVLIILHRKTSLKDNKTLFDLINSVKSFKVAVDYGNATASFHRGYWYVSKKILGKLYKEYVGTTARISEDLLTQKVRNVNNRYLSEKRESRIDGCEQIRQEIPYKSEPYELAGHQKNANHLQSNLITVNEELTMTKQALAALKATYETSQTDYMILHQRLRDVESDRLVIIAQRDKALNDLKEKEIEPSTKVKRIRWLETELVNAQTEQEKEIAKFRSLQTLDKEVIAEKNETILQLLREKDTLKNKLLPLEKDMNYAQNILNILYKYQNMAKGKTKQQNPRFSYLIDFLQEIDK